jgi:glucose-1-phosphate cytidylyltransferase
MKVVILAGGLGTRLSEETELRPKPMVEIGGMPMLWHIMNWYAKFGHTEFIICCGYKGYMIKEYFANYYSHFADVEYNLHSGEESVLNAEAENWTVTCVDTGENTMTGGRIKRAAPYIGNEPFLLTYGDGVGNVNIQEVIDQDNKDGNLVTLTAAHPTPRFGMLELSRGRVISFSEKPQESKSWVNAGFFVCQPGVLKLIDNDASIWEKHVLTELAMKGFLGAYEHEGFWKPMDTIHDKNELERMFQKEGNIYGC